jgi:uncharacterized SAM-binding protein YcdF (DUF218 family)
MIRRRGCSCGCLAPLLLLLLALALGALFHVWILTALGSYLVKDQPPRKADAIVVLAGDRFGYRILTAGKLVREGWAPYAIIDGTPYFGTNETEVAIAYALNNGYPPSYFRKFERDMDSTREETTRLVRELKKAGVHSIILVTSNYHTRRASSLMKEAAPWLSIDTVAAPDRYFSPAGWWKSRGGQRTFLYEWMKTLSAWVGY